MTAIELLAETSDTVTLGRRDSDALIAAVEIADDVALIDGCERAETALGRARARRDYLTDTEMQRLLDGGNRLRLWREKRGVPQGALARAIGVAASYLTEVETGSKPGSTELYQRVAAFLDLDLENLLPRDPPSGEPPMDRSDRAAFRLATRAGTRRNGS